MEYTPVGENQDKKHESYPMETTYFFLVVESDLLEIYFLQPQGVNNFIGLAPDE